MNQVNSTVVQMDSLTQNTAASAEQTAAASEELNGQGAHLLEVVSTLSNIISATQALRKHMTGNNHQPEAASEEPPPFALEHMEQGQSS